MPTSFSVLTHSQGRKHNITANKTTASLFTVQTLCTLSSETNPIIQKPENRFYKQTEVKQPRCQMTPRNSYIICPRKFKKKNTPAKGIWIIYNIWLRRFRESLFAILRQTTRLPLEAFSGNLIYEYFSKICRENFLPKMNEIKLRTTGSKIWILELHCMTIFVIIMKQSKVNLCTIFQELFIISFISITHHLYHAGSLNTEQSLK